MIYASDGALAVVNDGSCRRWALPSWHTSVSRAVLQVNHGLLAYADEPRARPVEIDDYGKNQGDGSRASTHIEKICRLPFKPNAYPTAIAASKPTMPFT
jgi:hypothetical protein